jgi:hypothetical protein
MSDYAAIEVLGTKVDVLIEGAAETRIVLKELSTAVSKLAVVEHKQADAAAATERAFKAIEKIELRLKVLEDAAPASKIANGFVMKAVGLVLAAFIGAQINTVIRPPQAQTVQIGSR